MSFLLKKDDSHGSKVDLSTFNNRKESISERDSPRIMRFLIKRLENASNAGVEATEVAKNGPEGMQSQKTTHSDENVVLKVNIIYTYIRV